VDEHGDEVRIAWQRAVQWQAIGTISCRENLMNDLEQFAALPVIIVFFAGQRYLIRGLAEGVGK
jgi:ABC-type glycerol-3-phosphate transport system permease component